MRVSFDANKKFTLETESYNNSLASLIEATRHVLNDSLFRPLDAFPNGKFFFSRQSLHLDSKSFFCSDSQFVQTVSSQGVQVIMNPRIAPKPTSLRK